MGNPSVTGDSPQRAGNAESIPIALRHNDMYVYHKTLMQAFQHYL